MYCSSYNTGEPRGDAQMGNDYITERLKSFLLVQECMLMHSEYHIETMLFATYDVDNHLGP